METLLFGLEWFFGCFIGRLDIFFVSFARECEPIPIKSLSNCSRKCGASQTLVTLANCNASAGVAEDHSSFRCSGSNVGCAKFHRYLFFLIGDQL